MRELPFPRRIMVPLIVASGLFMENLDAAVLATALPAIAAELGENPLRLNLAITSYLLSFAVFVPVSGWMADRFGARNVFRAAVVVFTLASIGCGLSQSLSDIVVARIVQGLGGAMMTPVGRLVVLRSVAKSELVGAWAYLTVPALIAPVFGPPLGGFLATFASWRWIFWINVPIGIVGLILVTIYIDDMRQADVPALDRRGLLLAALALPALMFGFENIGRATVPAFITVGLLLAGGAFLALYVVHAGRTANPLVDLRLLRIVTFRAGIAGGFLFRIGTGAMPFLLPLMLQLGFGMTPFEAGLVTFATAAGAIMMKFTMTAILRRIRFRTALIVNAVLSSAFLASCGLFRPETPVAVMIAVLVIGGYVRSLQFTATNTITYADLGPGEMSRATSFAAMMQQLSLTVGVGAGALFVYVAALRHGSGQPGAGDFGLAFFGVAAIAAASVAVFVLLPKDAGRALRPGTATDDGRGAAA
jgi:EmrB/QacA subfamily drug resistance transporter